MEPNPANLLPKLVLPPALAVAVRASPGSDVLACEPVQPTDLADVLAETWLHTCLRRGFPNLPLAELPLQVHPRFNGGVRCDGFDVEAVLPDGQRHRLAFGIASLSSVARRALQSLPASSILDEGRSHVYDLTVEGAAAAPPSLPAPPLAPAGGVTLRTPPLAFVRRPLAPLRAIAREVGVGTPNDLPVFMTELALRRATEVAVHGIQADPPLEAGGVLLGSLGWCDASREFFALIVDALELQEAEQTQFSLTFSSTDWARVSAILKARQAAAPDEKLRLIGQFHVHPFIPVDGVEGGCAQCPKQATCDLHSAFMSHDDQVWMHATYRRQPWALSFIVGLTPQRKVVTQLYGLRGGHWQSRSFAIIPDTQGLPWAANSKPPN